LPCRRAPARRTESPSPGRNWRSSTGPSRWPHGSAGTYVAATPHPLGVAYSSRSRPVPAELPGSGGSRSRRIRRTAGRRPVDCHIGDTHRTSPTPYLRTGADWLRRAPRSRRSKPLAHKRRPDREKGDGRGGAIRTLGLLNPIQVRYQAAPRPDRPTAYQKPEAGPARISPVGGACPSAWERPRRHPWV
jgi:hypothetical protein